MRTTKTISTEKAVKGGHTVLTTGVTAPTPATGDCHSPVDLFILLDHDFILEVSCCTDDRRIYETYFTADAS